MASNEDFRFPLDTNSFLLMNSPRKFSAPTEYCPENPSLLVSETEHNNSFGFVPVSAITNDLYPSSFIGNPSIGQETLTRTPRFDQELVTQNHRFLQENNYTKYFDGGENFSFMPSSGFYNGQRQNVCNENCLLGSTNEMMTTGLQPVGLQHGYVQQIYQQPLWLQSYQQPPLMMGSSVQEVEKTQGLANRNHNHPSLFQEEQSDTDLLLEQLKRIHEMDNMRSTKSSNMSIQTPGPENHSPFTHTSSEPHPNANDLQNSSLLNTTRRTRGRPRKYGIHMPLSLTGSTQPNVSLSPTTQTPLPSPSIQDKGKGKLHVTSMPSSDSTLYNQYQSTMNMQNGVSRQRDCYDQLENEFSSTKRRRSMLPYQETPIGDSSTSSYWQGENERSSAVNHQDERSTKNTAYDPFYSGVGLPSDPHSRFF